jgi:hypothetical protein
LEDRLTDDLAALVRYYEAAEQATQTGRAESEQARDYYDGKQLTDAEKETLRKRKQPQVVINRIKRKIDYLRGLERQSRTDPKAWPRTVQHEQDADAATDALRYVSADQNIDIKRSQVFENMLIEGFGGVEVTVTRGPKGVIDPKVSVIPWDRIFYDPHSSAHDFADAHYVGFVTWMDVETAKAKWPDRKAVLEQTEAKPTSTWSETYDDKPKWSYWYDANRKRLRVVTMYYKREDQWYRCEFTLAGHLTDPAPSPFMDEDGKPECALILQSAYIDRENDRYGIVRDMISPQDEVNKRRSKALHLLNTRQVRVSAAAGMSAQEVSKELAKPDGVIIAESGEVEVLQNGDVTAGHFQLMQEAKNEIDLMGPNATMQGKASQDSSGRAIMALQQGGMIEMAPLLDNLRHFTIRLYRQVWNRIRQFWTQERWVRVTDDERGVKFVGLNRPPELDPMQAQQAMMRLAQAVQSGQLPMEQAREYEAEIRKKAGPQNVVSELDVDIDISEVQETPTLQAEQFEQLMALAQTGTIPIPPEVIIEASTLRNKDKLLNMLEEAKKAQSQPNPMQELQMRGAQAEVAKTEAEADKIGAQAMTEKLTGAAKAAAAMSPQPPQQAAA